LKLKIPYLLGALVFTGALFYLANPQGLSAAPVLTLKAMDGRQLELAETAGKHRLISFFSPTCAISKRNATTLNRLAKTSAIEVIGIAMPYDTADGLQEWIHTPLAYPVVHDTDGSIADAFAGVRFTPTTFLIDQAGEVVWRKTGRLSNGYLKGKLDAIAPGRLALQNSQ